MLNRLLTSKSGRYVPVGSKDRCPLADAWKGFLAVTWLPKRCHPEADQLDEQR